MSIDYELAKSLKDAGFPQTKPYELWCLNCKKWRDIRCFDAMHEKEKIKLPTLEELIFAVGDKFLGVLRHDDGSGWTALKSGDQLFDNKKHSEGSTPSEAVAHLWLTLHRNNA